MNRCTHLKKEQGAVIIVALFVMALIAAMSYLMMARLQRDTRRTTLLVHQTQAENYANGSLAWARDQLYNDLLNRKKDRVVDPTPIESPVDHVNNYEIKSTIFDMQSRFNINNLLNQDYQSNFKRLLDQVLSNISQEESRALMSAIFDWIQQKPNDDHTGLSQYYLDQPNPYRPAHRPMKHISELRLVKGMTQARFEQLKPYLTALPSDTKINVQTAPLPVLLSLSLTMTKEDAQKIMESRKDKPITSIENFLKMPGVYNNNLSKDKIEIVSAYFLVETEVTIDDQHFIFHTLLKRSIEDGGGKVSIVWQSKGV